MEWHSFKTSIVFSFDDGENITINDTDDRYKKIKELLDSGKKNKLKTIEKMIKEPMNAVVGALKLVKGFKLDKNVILYKGEAIDAFVCKKIMEFHNAGKPYQYLYKFYERVLENPSSNSRLQLFKFLMHGRFPFTENGFFIAYKAVNRNFTDKWTGKMNCSIGEEVTMPRDKVTDNPNIACAAGLHIGTFGYAHGTYGGSGSVTLAVLVDPADVVSVPRDHNNEKCRCCAFKVLSTVDKAYDPNQLIVITDLESALKVDKPKKKAPAKKKVMSIDREFVIINKIDYQMCSIEDNEFRDISKDVKLIQPSKRLKYFKDLGKACKQVWKTPDGFVMKDERGKYVHFKPKDLCETKKTVAKPATKKPAAKKTTTKKAATKKPAAKKTAAKKSTAKKTVAKKTTTKKTATKTKSKAAKKGVVTIARKEYKITEIKETTFKKVKDLKSVKPSARNAYFKELDIIEKLWKNKTEFYLLTHDGRYVKYAPVKK